MRFAAQENLIHGDSFQDKVDNLRRYGYEGVELSGDKLAERAAQVRAVLASSQFSATCICGGFKFGLLSPSKADRDESRQQIKDLLAVAADVGATAGVIVVPIFGKPQVPDLTPWRTAVQIEEELLVEQLYELAEYAGQQGTKVILEPLNRYETHYLNRLDQAVAICQRVQSPHMTVLADFFHMSIEESDIAKSIRGAAQWLGYVHLADSNRQVPGFGHTDFRSGFQALRDAGYTGWMSLECGVPGDNGDTLTKSRQFMQDQLR